jgi:hypothetical protein
MDHTVLYEQFSDARREAIALTDRYHQADDTDPNRALLWQDVVLQTETAQRLLEAWLKAGSTAEPRDEEPAQGAPRQLAYAR